MTTTETTTKTPNITMTPWQKNVIPAGMWETILTELNGHSLKVSVFGVKDKKALDTVKVVNIALGVRDTLHLWQEQIVQEVVALAREFREEDLRTSMQLVNVLFDHEHRLSAIYFETPLLSGHRIVVEFDAGGEPYEAEITT